MDQATLTAAFGPAFAAGFALQRLIEILDPLVNLLVGEEKKKIILGLLSLSIGLAFAYALDLHVLTHLGVSGPAWLKHLDYLVAGLFISGGTEGFNALLKYLNYKKEETKVKATTERLNAMRVGSQSGTPAEGTMGKELLTKKTDSDDFTLGDAVSIAHNCTVEIAGESHELDPSATLEEYGIKSSEQEDLVKKDVRTNNDIGVPAFNRKISPNALKDLNKGWTIGKLRNVIFDSSQPAG